MTHPSVNSIVERLAIPSNDTDLLMLCTAHPSEAATIISELQAERDALSADLEKVQTELDEENIRALTAESSLSRIREETATAMKLAEEALARCYDVNDWPADGQTIQDQALSAIRSLGSTGGADSEEGSTQKEGSR